MKSRVIPILCRVAPALVLVAAFAAPAGAVEIGIGPHIGYVRAYDSDGGTSLYGGHIDLHLSPWVALQGSVDAWLCESIKLTSADSYGNLRVKSVPVTATLRLYLPIASSFAPFAGAGAGIYYVDRDYPKSINELHIKDDSSQEFGWHASAGLEVKLGRHASVYGEGRAVFADTGHKLDEDVVSDIKDFNYDSVAFTGGLSIHF